MKPFKLTPYRWLMCVLCALMLFVWPDRTAAQQQQYSNAYAYWLFGENSDDVENIDQKIQVVKPAPATQWVIMWNWVADPAHGGYLGFNTNDQGKGQALFSLWNADRANGANCQKFGGEGEGLSCRMPFDVNPETVYQLRLVRTKVEAQGVWWSAWIIENADADSPTEHFLGEIRVQPQMNLIRGNSIMNFSEYFGLVVEKCRMVPLSILALAPPAANKEKGSENYAYNSTRNGGSNPQDNPCRTGDEAAGNLFRVDNYEFFGAGAIVFAGASPDEYNPPKELPLQF